MNTIKKVLIKTIKKDTNVKGKEFYKVYFENIFFKENQLKVHFVHPGSKAYELFKENQLLEGDAIDATINSDGAFHTIVSIEKVYPKNEKVVKNI